MAVPKPMLTEFGIHFRFEICVPHSNFWYLLLKNSLNIFLTRSILDIMPAPCLVVAIWSGKIWQQWFIYHHLRCNFYPDEKAKKILVAHGRTHTSQVRVNSYREGILYQTCLTIWATARHSGSVVICCQGGWEHIHARYVCNIARVCFLQRCQTV